MRFRKLLLCLILSFLTFNYSSIFAEDDFYYVIDNNELIQEFESYSSAISFFNDNKDEYDNLIIKHNDEVIEMEYGIVEFNDELDYVKYHSISRGEDDYISATYGIDAAYLYSEDNKIYFKVANDIGYIDFDNVKLVPYDNNSSNYYTDDKYIYHKIKNPLNYESYKLDFIPDGLSNNSTYYSYDGHYFYDDFYLMIDDYRNGTYDNSVNQEIYFNYYQYLSHRSLSNYSYEELEDYFYNTLMIDGKLNHYIDSNNDNAADEINRSQLYDEIDDFFIYENIYGSNAMLTISSAIYESSYGRSESSFKQNNLFYTAAYDSIIASNHRYNTVSDSIYAHSKYIVSKRFGNYLKDDYKGTFLGDRLGGLEIEYTIDHYYGEKVAAIYFDIDNKLGLKDYKQRSIALFIDKDRLKLYSDESLDDVLYSLDDVEELAYVVLAENETSYKIQFDYSNNDEYIYDFEDCIAYVDKDDVSYILNVDKIQDNEFININYDFDGGTFIDKQTLELKALKDANILDNIKPRKDGYEFNNYVYVVDGESNTYIATYKKIKEITINNLLDEYDNYIDLSNASINVIYEDESSKLVPLNSDMVSFNSDDNELIISYCGFNINKNININYDDNSISLDEIRVKDIVLKEKQNRNYYIKNNTDFDFSISGLDLALDNYDKAFSFIKNTYYVELEDISLVNKEKIEKLAKGYDFEVLDGLNISFKYNYIDIDLKNKTIVQVDIKDKKDNYIYVAYHLNSDGDIIKCNSTWSNNYIQFEIEEAGDYLILGRPSINSYSIEDSVENLSINNMGYDNHDLNIKVMNICFLFVLSFIGVIVYYIVENKKEKQWIDFKKLLRNQDIAVEEKLKN